MVVALETHTTSQVQCGIGPYSWSTSRLVPLLVGEAAPAAFGFVVMPPCVPVVAVSQVLRIEHPTIVGCRLSRMARSVQHLTQLAAQLRDRGVDLVVLEQDLDTAVCPSMSSALWTSPPRPISEGTREGLAAVERVATWLAPLPGRTVRLAAATATSRDDIASVEVRTADGTRLLKLVA